MRYTPIVGTLGYILNSDKTKVLLVHRNARPDDDQIGKYNGLGGKMAMNEDVATCMKREIHEEAGIEVVKMSLRGTINWTGFGPKNENWLGFVFIIEEFTGTPNAKSPEGDLEWVEIAKIDSLPMWAGDRHFLPLVFDKDSRPFHGYMPYNGDTPLEWIFHRY
jgi:8-oxo-dGTP diphosphatase